MIRFQTILAFCLLGVLSPVIIAAESDSSVNDSATEPTSPEENKPLLSMEKQKRVVGQVITLLGDMVAQIVAEHQNGMKGTNSMPKKGIPGTYPFNNPVVVKAAASESGVAKIQYHGKGVICSGIHLRPWIILTVADCLRGKDVRKLYATVIFLDSDGKSGKSIPVQAESVTFDPRYRPGKRAHNVALLQLYGRFDWEVQEFLPPRFNFTASELINKNIATAVKEWKTYEDQRAVLASTGKKVSEDLEKCGDVELSGSHLYCATEPESGRDTYTLDDIGTPLYYLMNNVSRCLGIYTGDNTNRPMKGHLYQPFYPSIDWIDEYLQDHPMPPIPI